MRWLLVILVPAVLFVASCASAPGQQGQKIAVVNWQQASSAHPKYEALQTARLAWQQAAESRRRQAEQGRSQIALLQKMTALKQENGESFLAADFMTKMSEKEARELEGLNAELPVLAARADEAVAPMREEIIASYRLPLLNLRLRLENVRLKPEQRLQIEEELADLLQRQHAELAAVEQRRQSLLYAGIAEKRRAINERLKAYGQELRASRSSEQLSLAKKDGERLEAGLRELSALMHSLDKQVELKKTNYERLRSEIDADIGSALLKASAGRGDVFVVKDVLVNINAVDLTEKVSAELKNRQ